MTIKTFAQAEAVLAQSLPGYESRQPQQRLAEGVERLLSKKDHFVAYDGAEEDYPQWVRPGLTHFLGQAGTGTGKSLGYLIPAILSGRRVIVSVTTKALQNQLAGKDLPFLEEHLGLDFAWCVLKGRGNYLCLNRLALVSAEEVPDRPGIISILKEATAFDGARETIESILGHEIPFQSWSLICSDSDECADSGCTPQTCYAMAARARAQDCNIVIVNHALFFTDLVVKNYAGDANGGGGMLGEYDAVVFDEAHEMEEVAGNTLGGEVTQYSFATATAQIRGWAREHADDGVEPLVRVLSTLDGAATHFFSVLPKGRLTNPALADLNPQLVALYDALSDVRSALHKAKIDHSKNHDKAFKRKRALLRRMNSLNDRMETIAIGAQSEYVRWVEETRTKRGEVRVSIKVAPILVAPFLYQNLFTKVPCVLVSATLAVKHSFNHICARLGIPSPYEGLDVGTSFDYGTQGRIYIATRLPEPKGADQSQWQAAVSNEIPALIKASQGRALVLFTSVAHMKATAETLAYTCPEFDIRKQYDAPTNELTEWLKDHDPERPRVLLATKSFFTGVDIPGEALSLVVITKMPFPRPDEPLTEARCEAIEAAGGSAFAEYTIPVMSLVLQQATGRLIRTSTDRGVVAILDPRISSKGYGRTILKDLPPMPQITEVEQVRDFLEPVAV